jgi:signal peptidase II
MIALWWLKEKDFLTRIGLALCFGGAISNIIDRFLFGAVADFFHLHFGQHSIFVNNIADIIIFIGVLLLLPNMLQSTSKPSEEV